MGQSCWSQHKTKLMVDSILQLRKSCQDVSSSIESIDHRILKDGGASVQVMSMSSGIASHNDGERDLCLVDDRKMLKITMSNTKFMEQAQSEVNDH
ncbi:hypothetical protein Tco_1065139 [Tanacetum coccineum]